MSVSPVIGVTPPSVSTVSRRRPGVDSVKLPTFSTVPVSSIYSPDTRVFSVYLNVVLNNRVTITIVTFFQSTDPFTVFSSPDGDTVSCRLTCTDSVPLDGISLVTVSWVCGRPVYQGTSTTVT